MVVLKRFAWAGLAAAALFACGRDFSSPLLAAGSDSTGVAAPKTDSSKAKKDSLPIVVKPSPILIESLAASDLRLKAGETRPAPVTVLPRNATSPLYEMTSSKPSVAEVTPDGIRGAGPGTATITVHALDGSGKTTRFHVIVDAVFDICVLLPCLCADKGKGKDAKPDPDKGGCDD